MTRKLFKISALTLCTFMSLSLAPSGPLDLGSRAAEAATCRLIIYFLEPALVNSVGTWSNCPGMKGLVGRRTRYKLVSTETTSSPRPTAPGIPCDFTASGCSQFEARPSAGLD